MNGKGIKVHRTIVLWVVVWQKQESNLYHFPYDVNAKYKIEILTYLNKPTRLTEDWST